MIHRGMACAPVSHTEGGVASVSVKGVASVSARLGKGDLICVFVNLNEGGMAPLSVCVQEAWSVCQSQ